MPTLGTIYRDVNSQLSSLNIDRENILHQDVINAINDAIRELRVQYARDGNGGYFSETETITNFSTDANYPFLSTDTLSNEIEEDLPEYFTVLGSAAFAESKEITNSAQTFSKGDTARKGADLYKCVKDFSSLNTYNLVFDPRDARYIHEGDGLVFNSGDIVYDKENDNWYQANTDFTNDSGDAISTLSELDVLYWKLIGDAYYRTIHLKYEDLRRLELFEDSIDTLGFAIKGDTVYASPQMQELSITYIPKWTDVTTLSSNVNIPDFMISVVKERAIAKLARKINITIEQLTQLEDGSGDNRSS